MSLPSRHTEPLSDESIDQMVSEFNPSGQDVNNYKDRMRGITLWLPQDCHEDYLALQGESKRKFGRLCQEILIKAIKKASKKL